MLSSAHASVATFVSEQRLHGARPDPTVIEERRARRRVATRSYCARNPEKAKATTYRWRANNKTRHREMSNSWRRNNVVRALVTEARTRSKKRGVEFAITYKDVPPMGECCPLLGHPFSAHRSGRSPYSPSLDRIDPSKGYVPGNVWIVGYRANLVKNDGTAEEHEMIARALRSVLAVHAVSNAAP
jgi:hypothetical protein